MKERATPLSKSEVLAAKESLLEAIQRGHSLKAACDSLGITGRQVGSWRRFDKKWDRALEDAETLRLLVLDALRYGRQGEPVRCIVQAPYGRCPRPARPGEVTCEIHEIRPAKYASILEALDEE